MPRLLALVVLAAAVAVAAASSQSSDLDVLMAKVLERRDENWKKLRQYLLDEREDIAVVGPNGFRLWGDRREYTWFIRDAVFVRSPVRANGVDVSDADRRSYEDAFVRRAREREERAARDAAADPGRPPAESPSPAGPLPSTEALLSGMRQPAFIDQAYFLRFKFEPGRYALAGRDVMAGKNVLRVEYYPERLFTHEQRQQDERRARRERNRNEDVEASFERMMNKVALVTLWVEPEAGQIVKYTFDNVDLDFLPAARFLRVNALQAVMTMGQPFAGVWLPSTVEIRLSAAFAAGAVDIRQTIEYRNYREAAASGRLVSP